MPKMFGVRYADVRDFDVLSVLAKEKIVTLCPIATKYGADRYIVVSKEVNKSTARKIAKAVSEKYLEDFRADNSKA